MDERFSSFHRSVSKRLVFFNLLIRQIPDFANRCFDIHVPIYIVLVAGCLLNACTTTPVSTSRLSSSNIMSVPLLKVEAGNNTIMEAYTTKGDTASAWQDKKLVKILAIAGGCTLLVLIILVCTQGCVYYKHYFHGHTTTKVMVRDVYRARHSSIRGNIVISSIGMLVFIQKCFPVQYA